MNVVAASDGVFVDDIGPFRHTGGGVLEMNGQDTKWLFTRTAHEVILQKSDALAFRMSSRNPGTGTPARRFFPSACRFCLPFRLSCLGLYSDVRDQRVTSATCSPSQVSRHCSASTWNCSTTRRITSRKDRTAALIDSAVAPEPQLVGSNCGPVPHGFESAAVARLPRNSGAGKVPLRRAIGSIRHHRGRSVAILGTGRDSRVRGPVPLQEIQLPVQRSPVDERVAADRALLTALVRGEEDLYLHDRQLTDPGGRHGVNDFTVRAGGDLTRRADSPQCRPRAVTA